MTTDLRRTDITREAVYSTPSRVWALGAGAATYGLTDWELDVLYQLKEGLQEEQIALVLAVPRAAVQGDIASVMMKMHARSRTEAAVRAIKEGIFSRD
ncbi:MAG TPA: LuxR C-terminal-related transcriptional regulator [Dehalococcoidia bacterium]|jgi:DNA-binding NarL/FixJ family response regulator|nr:LuxR C-terminal-related transcriptional regulator [Dehalococcoidia bacterium]